jgi:hypothetical protein
VLSKIREDFDAAGVVQSDEQILRVMNELTLQAGNQMPVTPGGGPDALAVMLLRRLAFGRRLRHATILNSLQPRFLRQGDCSP